MPADPDDPRRRPASAQPLSPAQERRQIEELEQRREAEHAARLAAYRDQTGIDARDAYVLERVQRQTQERLAEVLDERRQEEEAAGTDSTIPWLKLIAVSLLVSGLLLALIYLSQGPGR